MSSSSKSRPSDNEAIEARAAAWLAQKDEGLSETEARAFAAWQAADPRHAAAVARLETTWRLLQGLRDAPLEAATDVPLAPVVRFPLRRWLPVGLGAAAAVALTATFFAYRSLPLGREPAVAVAAPQIFATAAGGFGRETLVDGSVVELNANTEVRVAYSAAERRVRLVHGEAHFTVAKNKHRPFWVEADGVSVRAVGTAFNVRLGERQVEVLVTEGRVRVDHGKTAATQTVVAPELGAGERAAISTSGAAAVRIEKVSVDVMRDALAWRRGPRLDFAGTPLAQVIDQFNQHNRVRLELGDPALGNEPVGGSFQAENVEAFVQLLTSQRDIVADRPSPDRIVLRRAN